MNICSLTTGDKNKTESRASVKAFGYMVNKHALKVTLARSRK